MTAATTSVNKKSSFFSVRFRNKFSEDLKLFITNMIFHLLCLPVLVGVLIRLFYYKDLIKKMVIMNYDETEIIPFLIIAVIAFVLSVGMGIVIPMVNFRYLYSKSQVDMNYSLPLNNCQRFCADFFSGMITYIVPPLCGAAIAGIELFIGSQFVNMEEILEFVPDVVSYGFAVIAGMILLYTLSVLAITFAGSTFEAIFSIFAVNVMIPAVLFLSWINIVNAAHFGLDSDAILNNYLFFTTSPVGAFSYIMFASERLTFDRLYSYREPYSFTSLFQNSLFANFMIRTLLFTALVFVISYLLYKHRKAEDVSKPYVYKSFYYIIMSLSIYCIISALKSAVQTSGLTAAIIISAILWFVMEVIRRRGFKRFWTAVISFAAASAAVIGLIKVIDVTQGLGAAKRIPSASSVTDLEIDSWGSAQNLSDEMVIHDPDVINDVIELNREMVDRHYNQDKYEYEFSEYDPEDYNNYSDNNKENNKENNKYIQDLQTFRFTYYTRNGSAIVRCYDVPTYMLADIYCDLYTSEEYAENKSANMFKNSLRRDNYSDYEEITPENAQYCGISIGDKLNMYSHEKISVEKGRELFDAFRRDIIAMQAEDFRNAEFCCILNDHVITSAYRNTIDFLEKNEIEYKKSAQELLSEIDVFSNSLNITDEVEYIFPKTYFTDTNYEGIEYRYDNADVEHEYIKLDSILSLGLYRDRSMVRYKGKHMEFTNDKYIEKLFDIAEPLVIGELPIAEIQYDNITLYILDRPGNREIVDAAKKTIKIYENTTGEYYSDYVAY